MPIPFSGNVFTIKNDESNYDFKFKLFKIPFRTYLGKDKSDKRVLLKKVVAGQIKVCESAIQIAKGKIFMLIALELPIKKKELDVYQIAEATLGIEHPITVHVGKNSLPIGTKEEFMYRRLAIQASRQRLQRSCRYTKGGKGKAKKLKALEQFEKKELQYIDSKLHLYSRRLIDFCIKTRSGNLLLTDQKAKEEQAKEDDLILRNWSYYGLIEKIKYKANMAGINVIVE
jgi:transposase